MQLAAWKVKANARKLLIVTKLSRSPKSDRWGLREKIRVRSANRRERAERHPGRPPLRVGGGPADEPDRSLVEVERDQPLAHAARALGGHREAVGAAVHPSDP